MGEQENNGHDNNIAQLCYKEKVVTLPRTQQCWTALSEIRLQNNSR